MPDGRSWSVSICTFWFPCANWWIFISPGIYSLVYCKRLQCHSNIWPEMVTQIRTQNASVWGKLKPWLEGGEGREEFFWWWGLLVGFCFLMLICASFTMLHNAQQFLSLWNVMCYLSVFLQCRFLLFPHFSFHFLNLNSQVPALFGTKYLQCS